MTPTATNHAQSRSDRIAEIHDASDEQTLYERALTMVLAADATQEQLLQCSYLNRNPEAYLRETLLTSDNQRPVILRYRDEWCVSVLRRTEFYGRGPTVKRALAEFVYNLEERAKRGLRAAHLALDVTAPRNAPAPPGADVPAPEAPPDGPKFTLRGDDKADSKTKETP